MAHTGQRNPVRWLVKARTREYHHVNVHGGENVGGHRRRVERWSKWQTHRSCTDVHIAIIQLAAVRAQLGLAEVAVWHNGVRLDDQQLKARAREDIERREGAES